MVAAMRHPFELHQSRRRGGIGAGWLAAAIVALGAVLGGGWGAIERIGTPAPLSAPAGLPGPAADSWAESRRSAEFLVGQEARPRPAPRAAAASSDVVRFGMCHSGGGSNCVVDGDTFWMAGEKIRIADIDAPETHPPRCADEAALGARATARLHALLNAGPVALEIDGRDTDRYGRKLRIVTRGGTSLGDMLVAEGLARPWTGRRMPWCA